MTYTGPERALTLRVMKQMIPILKKYVGLAYHNDEIGIAVKLQNAKDDIDKAIFILEDTST